MKITIIFLIVIFLSLISCKKDNSMVVEYYFRDIDTFLVDSNLYNHIDEYIANDELVSKLGFTKLK